MTASRSRSRSTSRSGSYGHRRGEAHPRANLTDQDVELMRELHEQHQLGYKRLALKFECSKETARDVCTYRTRC